MSFFSSLRALSSPSSVLFSLLLSSPPVCCPLRSSQLICFLSNYSSLLCSSLFSLLSFHYLYSFLLPSHLLIFSPLLSSLIANLLSYLPSCPLLIFPLLSSSLLLSALLPSFLPHCAFSFASHYTLISCPALYHSALCHSVTLSLPLSVCLSVCL